MAGLTRAATGNKLWDIQLLTEQDQPVKYQEPHPQAGQPIRYFVLAVDRDSVLYASRKFATREGVDHANSAYHWSEPVVFPGRVLSA